MVPVQLQLLPLLPVEAENAKYSMSQQAPRPTLCLQFEHGQRQPANQNL